MWVEVWGVTFNKCNAIEFSRSIKVTSLCSEKAYLPEIEKLAILCQPCIAPYFILNLILLLLGVAKIDWKVFLCFGTDRRRKVQYTVKEPKRSAGVHLVIRPLCAIHSVGINSSKVAPQSFQNETLLALCAMIYSLMWPHTEANFPFTGISCSTGFQNRAD